MPMTNNATVEIRRPYSTRSLKEEAFTIALATRSTLRSLQNKAVNRLSWAELSFVRPPSNRA